MCASREGRDAYRALIGKPEGRRPRGRSRLRWENNKNKGDGSMDWIDLAQFRDT
jgi:hypothetical protein